MKIKKIISLITIFVLSIGLITGCGNKQSSSDNKNNSSKKNSI